MMPNGEASDEEVVLVDDLEDEAGGGPRPGEEVRGDPSSPPARPPTPAPAPRGFRRGARGGRRPRRASRGGGALTTHGGLPGGAAG